MRQCIGHLPNHSQVARPLAERVCHAEGAVAGRRGTVLQPGVRLNRVPLEAGAHRMTGAGQKTVLRSVSEGSTPVSPADDCWALTFCLDRDGSADPSSDRSAGCRDTRRADLHSHDQNSAQPRETGPLGVPLRRDASRCEPPRSPPFPRSTPNSKCGVTPRVRG